MNKKEFEEWLEKVLKEIGQRYMMLNDDAHVWLAMSILGDRPDDVSYMVLTRDDFISMRGKIKDPRQPMLDGGLLFDDQNEGCQNDDNEKGDNNE